MNFWHSISLSACLIAATALLNSNFHTWFDQSTIRAGYLLQRPIILRCVSFGCFWSNQTISFRIFCNNQIMRKIKSCAHCSLFSEVLHRSATPNDEFTIRTARSFHPSLKSGEPTWPLNPEIIPLKHFIIGIFAAWITGFLPALLSFLFLILLPVIKTDRHGIYQNLRWKKMLGIILK